ncbi:MAG: DUF1360 domain-containing protein [Candidatus Latescibacterota bacterium]
MTEPTLPAPPRPRPTGRRQPSPSRPAPFGGYGAGEDMPLAGYAALLAVYCLGVAAAIRVARRRGRLPTQIGVGDLLLLGAAAHNLSRKVTKGVVTSPLRAPFTQFEHLAGRSETTESARGRGLRRALGDLLTCPWCFATWASTLLGFGFVFFPRGTRLLSSILTANAIADFLQLLFVSTRDRLRKGAPRRRRERPATAPTREAGAG